MSLLYPPAPPVPARPVSTRTPVSPCHLPAVGHVASDLDGLTVPVRVVPATELGVCVECSSGPNGDLPVGDAVAVVRATDAYGNATEDEVCAVHLHDVTSGHVRRERRVTVDVPATEGNRWFERSDRETFYATDSFCRDEMTGVAVVRSMWDVWVVIDVTNGLGGTRALYSPGLADGESWEDSRVRAEVWAQDEAARRAADAYEAAQSAETADAATVALPVVAVTEVAA